MSRYIYEASDDLAKVIVEQMAGKLPIDANGEQVAARNEQVWALTRALEAFGHSVVAEAEVEHAQAEIDRAVY
jgi:hypothetical protein